MSLIRRFLDSNTALASAALFLLALIAAPAAMSSIRKVDVLVGPPSPVAVEDTVDVTVASMLEVVGASGNLRAVIGTPETLTEITALEPLLAGKDIVAGIQPLGAQAPDGDPLTLVAMKSFDATKGARQDGYYVGRWARSGLAARNPRYAPPTGFISVTEENASTPVSERFRLADFLTHDQQSVWPKVLVLQPRLLDKLELIAEGLERRGLPSDLRILSGFRTPQYNEQGVGRKGGRASASRHMYGDAADVFVDANGDQRMDDLNRDGRINGRDAKVLFAVAEEVERQHPELIGGLSAYSPTKAHSGFVHVDARGHRARW
jgi:hypothetical protein